MRRDPHSWCDDTQPAVEHLKWHARLDFDARVITAEATLALRRPANEGPLDLDTRELTIEAVLDGRGEPRAFELSPPAPILGSRLRIQLRAGDTALVIRYRTSPDASALQWLAPAMTAGGKWPFVFSQCQAIHARSVVPLQDTPRVRITYDAELVVPPALTALMAAGRGRTFEAGGEKHASFSMPQPIPPYLFAFAVGELREQALSPRASVWAEPAMLERAAHEFADVERMIATAEKLFGAYDWERFDILVMPPSFPYGGMENPRLTFLTPTLVVGDCSLVSVVAHELAHSWTGNLVSNASAEHFWLNEGMTTYAERRIVEALDGAEVAALQAAVGLRDLEKAITRFANNPELTKLHTRLDGIDPDDAFSEVPYEKGYLFLRAIEDVVGRAAFDRFLHAWVTKFRFAAVTTAEFVAACERELPGVLAAVDGAAWLDAPGIPPNAPRPRSSRLEAIERASAHSAATSAAPAKAETQHWLPVEWELYLESLPRPAPPSLVAAIDRECSLTQTKNYEVLVPWLTLAIAAGHDAVLPRVEEVLGEVGRMKYLRPLYTALVARADTRAVAERALAQHRDAYHPIARQLVESLLGRRQA
jgi:leukotriene-A4 hydrolase